MISDVLHDAVEHIEQYQRATRFAYGPLRRKINEVTRYMKGLQRYLDTPPVEPFHKEALDRLNSMLKLPRGVRRTRRNKQTTNP